MKPKKISLDNLLDLMEPEHKRVALAVRKHFESKFDVIPGSGANHQAWVGGYRAHIEEAMNIADFLYDDLHARRSLPFSKSQALFCVYMHDYDKLQRYQVKKDGNFTSELYTGRDYLAETQKQLRSIFNYELSAEEYNAIKYAHGEGDDYSKDRRIISPLGTLVHCADIISARIWFDDGRNSNAWDD